MRAQIDNAIGAAFAMATADPPGNPDAPGKATRRSWPDLRESDLVLRDFCFASGETLPELRLHYTTLGTPRRDRDGHIDNAVLLLHSTMGSGKSWLLPSLADELFLAGQPLDAAAHFIVLPDAIGHGRSSKPSDGLRARFPRYRYGDVVAAQHRVVTQALGLRRLRLVLGASMGAMQAWIWGYAYPDLIDALVPLASEPLAPGGRNWLFRRMMIEAIRNDPDWKGGAYERSPAHCIYTAPLLSMMALSAAQIEQRAGSMAAADALYAAMVEDARELDANDLLYALEAIMDFAPGEQLEKIRAAVLAINFADDALLPPRPELLEREFKRIPGAKHVLLTPRGVGFGHFTFMAAKVWKPLLADFLARV